MLKNLFRGGFDANAMNDVSHIVLFIVRVVSWVRPLKMIYMIGTFVASIYSLRLSLI
jgi:hypothetical protein